MNADRLLMAEAVYNRQMQFGHPDDIQSDSLPYMGNPAEARMQPDLHKNLIDIAEEMGEEDFESLKFLCRDCIAAGKLGSAADSLEVFQYLVKEGIISLENLDFLLECLVRIHHADLVKKLGFDPGAVKRNLPNLVNPFRVLLLEIGEDIDASEFEKMKFWMSSHIKKKRLQEQKTVFELFVYMEKENLLSLEDMDGLVDILKSIRREDLIEMIHTFNGKPKQAVVKSNFTRNGETQQPPPQHALGIGPMPPDTARQHMIAPNPAVGTRQYVTAVQSGATTANNNNTGPVPPSPLDRSPSAGTLSVPSDENSDLAANQYTGPVPEPIFLQIVNDLKDQFNDLGIELGFTNNEIERYNTTYPDPNLRTRQLLMDWQAKKVDKGEIIPGLVYTLEKLGCKSSSVALRKYTQRLGQERSQGQGHRVTSAAAAPGNFPQNAGGTIAPGEVFMPMGPPEENVYTSLTPAQPHVSTQLTAREAPVGGASTIDPRLQQTVVVQGTYPAHTSSVPVLNISELGQLANVGNVNELGQHLSQLLIQQNLPADQISTQVIRMSRQLQFPQNNEQNAQNMQPNTAAGQRSDVVAGGNQGQGQAMSNVSEDSPELPEYRMNRKPRGWCVIINNKDFHVPNGDPSGKEMPKRNGTDVDAESLQYIFEKLGFIVRRRDNQTDVQMMAYMVDVAHNVNHTEFDAFVCCILTHGVQGHVYGVNGRLVSTRDLTSMFQSNRCPSLAGKPKMFFLQACQGRDKMEGGEIERDGPLYADAKGDKPMNGREELVTDGDKEMIPNESDFLLGYATVPGYVSFRSKHHGSWYIRKLCELLEKLSPRHDLMSILVEVNREVSRANANIEGGLFKQTPAPLFTLRKKLFFK